MLLPIIDAPDFGQDFGADLRLDVLSASRCYWYAGLWEVGIWFGSSLFLPSSVVSAAALGARSFVDVWNVSVLSVVFIPIFFQDCDGGEVGLTAGCFNCCSECGEVDLRDLRHDNMALLFSSFQWRAQVLWKIHECKNPYFILMFNELNYMLTSEIVIFES